MCMQADQQWSQCSFKKSEKKLVLVFWPLRQSLLFNKVPTELLESLILCVRLFFISWRNRQMSQGETHCSPSVSLLQQPCHVGTIQCCYWMYLPHSHSPNITFLIHYLCHSTFFPPFYWNELKRREIAHELIFFKNQKPQLSKWEIVIFQQYTINTIFTKTVATVEKIKARSLLQINRNKLLGTQKPRKFSKGKRFTELFIKAAIHKSTNRFFKKIFALQYLDTHGKNRNENTKIHTKWF